MTMAVAVFYVLRPTGGFVAKCDSFPDWRYETDLDTPQQRTAAEDDFRQYFTDNLCVVPYEVPYTVNQALRMAA